ncbi:MraY family glycosyltransferase [Woodsholea maritima]|uniref:hypothetical protein n=1 Tax=Woodsholea maritima TaxID=240237 RepID=UPI00036EE8CC|nr:hypothetical protein [Woodsholea maritima]
MNLLAMGAMGLVIPAALMGWAVTRLAVSGAVLDFPNARSSHLRPTPRSGGIGIVAGFMLALALASTVPSPADPDALALVKLIIFALVMGGLGLTDDLLSLPAKLKFTIMVLTIGLYVWFAQPVMLIEFTGHVHVTLPFVVGLLGSALFLFVVINATNFMDGANGMLVAGMFPAGVGLGVMGIMQDVPLAAYAGFSLAGALAGFALLNWDPAKIFAGDVGSLFCGAVMGAGGLALAVKGYPGTVWLIPLLVLPFVGDVLLTLLKRARAGRLSLAAHREHAYQMLLRAGISHARAAEAYACGATACSGLAVAVATGPVVLKLIALVLASLAFTVIYYRIHSFAYSQGVEKTAY